VPRLRRSQRAAATLGERFGPYQTLEAEVERLGRAGRHAEAVAEERAAQQLLCELTPHIFPPEVKKCDAQEARRLLRSGR
jgi:hypothetical protein